MLSVGLMSGTSMDGIDAALLETDGSSALLKELGHVSVSYASPYKILLKAAEFTIRQAQGNMDHAFATFPTQLDIFLRDELQLLPEQISARKIELSSYLQQPCRLEAVFAHSSYLHGMAVKKLLATLGYSSQQIKVIGYHGQAMFHQPAMQISIIIGDGQYLANEIGVPVVNDFRSSDIAAGGQGAPFAPLYHQALALRDEKIPVAVINCGGIANVTFIRNAEELELIAFDTGPGNGLLDNLIRQRTRGAHHMDQDGQYASQGHVHPAVLESLYKKSILKKGKNYFELPPPKALDIGDLVLIEELNALSLPDACATLAAFTSDSIVESCARFYPHELPRQWILAGGGWYNVVIRRELENRLQSKLGKPLQILTADAIGWNNQALEAQIFAYLAVRSLLQKPLSVPGTTGVSIPLTGGRVYFPVTTNA